MAKYQNVKLEGYAQLQHRLSTDVILGSEFGQTMRDATRKVHEVVLRWTPRKTGALAGAVKWEVEQGPVPKWGRVHVRNMPTRSGFRYGGALEGGKKRQYKYASGPKRGKLTRGWFGRAKGRSSAAVNKLFAALDRKIRANWDRG